MKNFIEHSVVALILAVVLFACNTNKNDIIPDPEPGYYAQFVIGTDTILYEDGVDSYGNGVGIATYSDTLGRLHSEYSTFLRNSSNPDHDKNKLGIQMVKFYSDTAWPSFNERYAQFNTGAYDYGSYSEDSTTAGIDGVVILYTDGDGKPWSSDLQYGLQETWSAFQITSHDPSGDQQFGATTEGTFSCRVFDGAGGHLDLTNGEFKARTIYPEQ